MSAPDVRWKPDGDDAGVYVYVPRHGSWRRVDLPYGGCGREALPEGAVRLVPADRAVILTPCDEDAQRLAEAMHAVDETCNGDCGAVTDPIELRMFRAVLERLAAGGER